MRAALYFRVSTAEQVEKLSLSAQRRLLAEYAERQDWEYEIYEDPGISGETLDARPEMLRLLHDARAGCVQVAVAIEMERFSRSQDLLDWLVIKQATAEKGRHVFERAVTQMVEMVRWFRTRPRPERRDHHAVPPTFGW